MQIILAFIGICLLIYLCFMALPFILIFLAIFFVINIFIELYYKSKKFQEIKESITDYIKECNELNEHIEDLKKSYQKVYSSNTLGHTTYTNDSRFNYKKPFLKQEQTSTQTVDCSLTVCRNAQKDPLKYLCKYFNISETEESLTYFEKILNDFSSAEQGKELLKLQEEQIISNISDRIPFIIKKFDHKRLNKKLGFTPIDFSQLYFPKYTFRYISPGGNSSNKVDIVLDLDNLNDLVVYLSNKIKYNKSAKKQRALMTLSFREKIKARDNYTCKICNISTYQEPHLLLEIDHKIPVSKGGLSTEENLQTLCWKCNRNKSAKMPIEQ